MGVSKVSPELIQRLSQTLQQWNETRFALFQAMQMVQTAAQTVEKMENEMIALGNALIRELPSAERPQ